MSSWSLRIEEKCGWQPFSMPWQAHSNQAHQLTGRKWRREAREGIKSLNLAVHLHETEKHSTSDKAVTKNLMRMRINCEFCCLLLNFHGELTRGLNAGTIKINSNVANNKHSFADYVPENNITRARGAIKNIHRHSGSQKKFACNLFELLLICISFRKTLNWNLHKNLRLNSVRGKKQREMKNRRNQISNSMPSMNIRVVKYFSAPSRQVVDYEALLRQLCTKFTWTTTCREL